MNFQYLDQLPSLPEEIVAEIYRLVNASNSNYQSSSDVGLQLNSIDKVLLDKLKEFTCNKDDSLGFQMDTAGNYFCDLAKFDFLPATKTITEWVNTNIDCKHVYISIQVMRGGKKIPPHIDEGRTYAYNYLLETGGAITKFYKAAKEYEHLTAYPQTIFTYDRIEEIESINIKKNKWHYLNVNKIHNVENIQLEQQRISLSVGYV